MKEVLTPPILQWTNTADRAGPLSVSSQHAPPWPLGSFRIPGGHYAVLAVIPSVLDTLVHHALTYTVMSSTTTINIQNIQAEACNNVKDDYVHVGLSVGGGGGGGASHFYVQQNS